jgi:hypothetical protein
MANARAHRVALGAALGAILVTGATVPAFAGEPSAATRALAWSTAGPASRLAFTPPHRDPRHGVNLLTTSATVADGHAQGGTP